VLGRDFGAKLEFVRGEAEERLLHEFQGAAALLRW
jgi:peptide subunit release factor 1 (eRF1)